MSQDYYGEVSQAFDVAAQNYDRLYHNNFMMAWMRAESLAMLKSTFQPGSLLLEIGCGTGDEAVSLVSAGHRVVATDISPGMIAEAQRKARAAEVSVTWHTLPAGNLAMLSRNYGRAEFDGAYASFGALNCEANLEAVVHALADLLRPGAQVVCSVMNRWCAWEVAWNLLHLKLRLAARRMGRGLKPAGLACPGGSESVPVRYYAPGEFGRAFEPHFKVRSEWGLPVLLPPPYLSPLIDKRRRMFSVLERAERHVRGWFPFRALGDHFVIVLARVDAAGAIR